MYVVLYHVCTVVQVSKALLGENKKRSRSTARIHRRAGDECDCAGCVCNRGVAVIIDGGRIFFHIRKPRPYFLCGREIERLDWLVFLVD